MRSKTSESLLHDLGVWSEIWDRPVWIKNPGERPKKPKVAIYHPEAIPNRMKRNCLLFEGDDQFPNFARKLLQWRATIQFSLVVDGSPESKWAVNMLSTMHMKSITEFKLEAVDFYWKWFYLLYLLSLDEPLFYWRIGLSIGRRSSAEQRMKVQAGNGWF